MIDEELSNQFDVLFNNITSNQAPGLSEYEKSVLLTKAQDEILKNYFTANSKGNNLGQGFDDSAKRQIDFSMLTVSATKTNVRTGDGETFDPHDNTAIVELPEDVMLIINERANVYRSGSTKPVYLTVIPLKFDEYNRLMSKPFKRPVKNQAWRLINSTSKNRADIVIGPGDRFIAYIVRYIRRPKPIIVGDLDGLTINGYMYGSGKDNLTSGCELDPLLHEEILQRAVELAKISWTQTGQDNAQLVMQAGQRSE